jgi:hypothetical protein
MMIHDGLIRLNHVFTSYEQCPVSDLLHLLEVVLVTVHVVLAKKARVHYYVVLGKPLEVVLEIEVAAADLQVAVAASLDEDRCLDDPWAPSNVSANPMNKIMHH